MVAVEGLCIMTQKKSRLTDFHRPFWQEAIHWLLKLPRMVRITMVGLFALAITLSLSPLVDYVYLSYMFTEETRVLPSLVSAAIGVTAYILGWWLMIGTVGELPPPRRLVLIYVLVGIFALSLVIVLTINGFSTATAPT
jgi:hypothetical protein